MANENVHVLTSQGNYITLEEWQKKYEISEGKLGKYFSLREQRFQDDLTLYKTLVVCEPLIRVLDALREDVGHALHLNSFNRDQAKQNQLKKDGFRAAVNSPHVMKMAADVDTVTVEQTRALAKRAIEVGKKIGIPIRTGSEDYIAIGQTFVHIDVCPVYFGAGKPFHALDHPKAWEKEYSQW
jgi:hypothetical protein